MVPDHHPRQHPGDLRGGDRRVGAGCCGCTAPWRSQAGRRRSRARRRACAKCGRKIRVLPTVLAAGPITCGICGTDFAPDLPDQDEDSPDEGAGE